MRTITVEHVLDTRRRWCRDRCWRRPSTRRLDRFREYSSDARHATSGNVKTCYQRNTIIFMDHAALGPDTSFCELDDLVATFLRNIHDVDLVLVQHLVIIFPQV